LKIYDVQKQHTVMDLTYGLIITTNVREVKLEMHLGGSLNFTGQ